MKVVCISDTHGDHAQLQLPGGDVLVHAGDITAHGSRDDYLDFLEWFAAQPHRHRVFVPGNHDTWLEHEPDEAERLASAAGVWMLNDSGVRFDGLNVWGSPITPRFHDWSFMRDPGADIRAHWDLIPTDVDVLVTHGPPHGVLDEVERGPGDTEHTGCPSLLEALARVAPAVHVFGHIHEGHGRASVGDVRCLNVSTMNRFYRIEHAPVVLDLPAPSRHASGVAAARRDAALELPPTTRGPLCT